MLNSIQIWPNTKFTLEKLPRTFNILPKWRNFAKSGHSGDDHDEGDSPDSDRSNKNKSPDQCDQIRAKF